MKNFGRALFALSLAGMCLCATSAQEKMSIPKVLQIQREFLKPGKAGSIHEAKESAFIEAMSRAKWPTHYIGMTSLSGKSRALFFTSYESFDAWEKDYAGVSKNAALASALDRAYAADGELQDSTDTGVFLFQEEMSLHPKPDLSAARLLEISAYHVRPGHNKEWTEAVKLVKAAYEKGVPESHWGVFEQAYGGDGGTYLVLTSHKSLSEVDQGFADDKKFVATMGEDGMKKLSELIAACVESSQHQLFAINPHMSYVSDESYIKGCQGEKILPSAGRRSFFLGIQPNRLNVHSESGLPQVLRPRLVSACEAENQLLCPVVPSHCCDGAHHFRKQQA